MRAKRQQFVENHEDNHYWISISDLMTSLLFIFILILAYTIYTFSEKTNELNEKSIQLSQSFESRSDLLVELKNDLKHEGINVDIDPKNGNMRIRSDGLFAVGSADLSTKGQYTLNQVANNIRSKMLQPKYKQAIDTIFIEGHTDNVPITNGGYGRRWTNMELSAQRAINTYLVMDEGASVSQMTNRDGNYLFSYSGYADQRPTASNETEAGRQQNRRIEIFFALTSPQLDELKTVE